MKEIDRKSFILHSRSKTFQKRVGQSIGIIEKALTAKQKWYVAFSGGKDSTVVLNLVLKLLPDSFIFWSDEEFFLPETGEYIQRLKKNGLNIRQCNGEIKPTEWFTSNKDKQGTGKTALAKSLNLGGVFLGLRAEENGYRKIFLRKYSPLYFAENRDIWLCNPIAWWTVRDVWTYIISNELDYNKAYDKLSDLGLTLDRQRIGPYATEKVLGYGQLVILKMGWPEEYHRFVKKFPQASGYV